MMPMSAIPTPLTDRAERLLEGVGRWLDSQDVTAWRLASEGVLWGVVFFAVIVVIGLAIGVGGIVAEENERLKRAGLGQQVAGYISLIVMAGLVVLAASYVWRVLA